MSGFGGHDESDSMHPRTSDPGLSMPVSYLRVAGTTGARMPGVASPGFAPGGRTETQRCSNLNYARTRRNSYAHGAYE